VVVGQFGRLFEPRIDRLNLVIRWKDHRCSLLQRWLYRRSQ
jgi:hypothetical protein